MTNEVSTINRKFSLAAYSGGQNPFQQHAAEAGVTGGTYMRHNGNTGKYIVGDAETAGGAFIFDMMTARFAWLGFDNDNRPVNGPEVLLVDGTPLPDHAADPTVKWIKQVKVAVLNPDTGEEILLSCKADKKGRSIFRLIQDFGNKMGMNPDPDLPDTPMFPVVDCTSEQFEMDVTEKKADGTPYKMRVKKYAEKFELVGWFSHAEVAALRKGAVQKQEEEKNVPEGTVEILPPEKNKTMPDTKAASARSRFGNR